MSIHRRTMAGLMAGGCLILTACAPTGAHLSTQTDASSMACTPSDGQGQIAIAQVHIHADGSHPVLIREVTPKKSDNVRIESFGVIPDGEEGFRGVSLPSDPDAQISTNHEAAAGEHATVQLVVSLVSPLKSGVIESVELEYDNLGRTGSETVTAGLRAQVFPAGEAVPDDSMCAMSGE